MGGCARTRHSWPWRHAVAIRFIVIACSIAAVERGFSGDLPRYQLEVGQELVYQTATQHWYSDDGEEPEKYDETWRVCVLDELPQGGWRLLAEYHNADPSAEVRPIVAIDLSPRGQVASDPALDYLPAWQSVRAIFPLLPATAAELEAGWSDTDRRTGTTHEYRRSEEPSSTDRFQLVSTIDEPIGRVAEGARHGEFTFDHPTGLVIQTSEQGHFKDYSERHRQDTKLVGNTQLPPERLSGLRADVARAIDALTRRRQLLASDSAMRWIRAAGTRPELERRLGEAKSLFASARDEAQSPLVRAFLERSLEAHDRTAEYVLDEYDVLAKPIGQPAPAWEAVDLQGRTHRLADSRGKVVVLDFWFRKCNYCIRAEPQFERVVAHFRDKPVVFLGMNVDEDEADARFAVAQLQPDYPTLLAKGIDEQFGVRGCPTWLVIDGEGRLHDRFAGFSWRLEEELTEMIDQALQAK